MTKRTKRTIYKLMSKINKLKTKIIIFQDPLIKNKSFSHSGFTIKIPKLIKL